MSGWSGGEERNTVILKREPREPIKPTATSWWLDVQPDGFTEQARKRFENAPPSKFDRLVSRDLSQAGLTSAYVPQVERS